MAIYIPTYHDIIELHDAVLMISGGHGGIRTDTDIHRAVERPRTFKQYSNKFTLDTVCALLITSIACYHGFNDGNKRTALMTAIMTYRINDVHFSSTEDMNTDFDELVMWVVNSKPEIDDIESRLTDLRNTYEVKSKQRINVLLTSFVTTYFKKLEKRNK